MNATGALGMVQVMLGQEDGLEHLQRWAAHYREHVPAAAPYATLHAASAATIFGRRDLALPLLDLDPTLEDTVRPMGYGPVTLAQTYLALGRPDDARRVLDGAPTYDGDQVGQWHLTLTRALHRLATGDPAAAADQLQARPA
ncbi:hypothetical protein [Deinococcus radiotolerans]|uniref:Tetratricopeptide repeat protein n=1 Tax=Deinococcus radiotolerans TaxID=1309407 RepID=A0ABQ2FRT6_9DEIO|nr:hypothetical protein [Deinococcus radiotolerans]GGL20108.1 hypothetical protein GCM10010844_43770 [Deinococcus radiotolerans]